MTILHKQKWVLITTQRYLKTFKEIPGPKSLPFIGTLHQYLPLIGKFKFSELHHNGLKKYLKHGPVVKEEIVPGVNIIWLFDPNDIEMMFRCEGKYPQRRSHLALQKFRLDRPYIYNTGGLLPINGPDWFRLRKIFQKGLSGPVAVKKLLRGSNSITSEWLERVECVRRESNVDYSPQLSRLFLELTGDAVLDLRLNSFSKEELNKNSRTSKLIKSAYDTNSIILKLDNGPQLWRKFDTFLYKKLKNAQLYMEDVAIDLLSLKMSLFSERNINKDLTLLEQYLSCPDLDFKDIIGMICDFLLAGIDTATYTTSFLLYHIGKEPGVQMQLYEETCKLLPNKNSPVTEQVLNDAHYAKATLKELFRLNPISVGIGRVLHETAVFSDYEVPQDTVVVSQNQISCRLEKYFPAPHEFKPERWLKNHPLYQKSHPFLLIPFGYGPRTCIARHLAEQNILVLLLKLIRNYKIEWSGSILDSKSLLINSPDGPIVLKLDPR
ncbi:cytochrome P450 302a1, mitochondrial [Euwallacea similis]|uniref:cytochrome P450 302a1, mitochondrial n=1 Tax=Euwallacea similis TaxID=1736056 RepID=UPI00344F5E8E